MKNTDTERIEDLEAEEPLLLEKAAPGQRLGSTGLKGEREIGDMSWFQAVLLYLREQNATDIYILEDRPVRIGLLKECGPIMPIIKPSAKQVLQLLEIIRPTDMQPRLDDRSPGQNLEPGYPYLEFAFSVKNFGRFRVSCSVSEEGMGFAMRKQPYMIPTIESLDKFNFLEKFKKIILFEHRVPSGLILHTGITGSGKSTLIASELDLLASRLSGAIYTLENPIEYRYTARKAFIRQFEIGRHLPNFLEGIRMSLRNNLSALMIGEVRTREEIHALIDASMRGCLVFSTAHTSNVMNTLRFIEGMGGPDKDSWRQMVAYSLKAIVSQKLIYKEKYGFILIPEILIPDSVVRTKIAAGKYIDIENMWQSNQLKETGSISFGDALSELNKEGVITNKEKDELAL